MFDWNLKTSLEGLYAAGSTLAWGADHSGSACTGRYAGRNAAVYAMKAKEGMIDRSQIENEKERVYAPIRRKKGLVRKELKAGLARIMQDYCGEVKHEEALKLGLDWINSIRKSEFSMAYARNPHELGRSIEFMTGVNLSEAVIHACLNRKACSPRLGMNRTDYPDLDPPEWNKYLTIKLKDGEIKAGEVPFKYWLLPPYSDKYEDNYQTHSNLD